MANLNLNICQSENCQFTGTSDVNIYTLSDPRDNNIRYVGKTIYSLEKRLSQHISSSKHKHSYVSNWINHLIKNNVKPKIEILDTTNKDEWKQVEKYWISQIKTWGFELTNISEGGDGGDVIKSLSPEKRLLFLKKLSKSTLGHKHSEETKKKIGESSINRVKSKDSISKFIKTRRENGGFKCKPETKDKISNTLKKKYHNKELISPFRFRTKEQKRKSADAAKVKLSKKVLCIDIKDGNKIEFNSITEAERKLNISRSCIIHNLKGRTELNKKKYKFSYI